MRPAGGAAALTRRTPDTVSGYDAITGDAGLLPDVRWAAAAAHEAHVPSAGAAPEP
ncbi:hypothetical protein AB0L14_18990 [Streptomyces sp. NPDC052727]|uniref:hypothetical protein n=1 Tax=Streptomyces sp. NPDC052727 TaxID=3154854 RepID=UPI00342BA1EB